VTSVRQRRSRKLFASLRGSNTSRDDRLALYRFIVCRSDIASTNDLTDIELETVADQIWSWRQTGHLAEKIGQATKENTT
tara:strand:- start:5991 stop:6230 length:240 start_codon:yes stop_codon:yes gene_type:complete